MILADAQAMVEAGAALAGTLRAGDVITLSGPLGAGKTTLVRGLIEALGHRGDVPSPSFAIVQPYDELSPPVWHVDLYRLDDPSELDELGLDEAGEGVLIVEWPERAGPAAWPEALQITLSFAGEGQRRLTAHRPPAWEKRWPF